MRLGSLRACPANLKTSRSGMGCSGGGAECANPSPQRPPFCVRKKCSYLLYVGLVVVVPRLQLMAPSLISRLPAMHNSQPEPVEQRASPPASCLLLLLPPSPLGLLPVDSLSFENPALHGCLTGFNRRRWLHWSDWHDGIDASGAAEGTLSHWNPRQLVCNQGPVSPQSCQSVFVRWCG